MGSRVHLNLVTCRNRGQAELRQQVIVGLVEQLRAARKEASILPVCRQAAAADDEVLPAIQKLVAGLALGSERVAPSPVGQTVVEAASPTISLREFGAKWTGNQLAAQYRGRVRSINHAENARRLEKHVYRITYRGRAIGDIPLNEFDLDIADHVLAQATLPEGSLRHVAQCLHRIFKLAVYPVRLLDRSPFPAGWLPPANGLKERGYLYPAEDAALMRALGVPLVWRLLFGFLAREGLRREDAATLEWSNLSLGQGHLVLDQTKNGRGASWAMDVGTTEALRRWNTLCPAGRWVFPSEALPRYRRRRHGQPIHVNHAAATLRGALKEAGIEREKLFQNGNNRLQLRAHDLRATFVTLALACGKSEDWVMQRTGHSSSSMLSRYRREAKTAQELNLGWLEPLHEAIPELSVLSRSTVALAAAY